MIHNYLKIIFIKLYDDVDNDIDSNGLLTFTCVL